MKCAIAEVVKNINTVTEKSKLIQLTGNKNKASVHSIPLN